MDFKTGTVLSFSPTGTTQMVAKAVLQGLGGGKFCDVTVSGEAMSFAPGQIVAVAVPVFGGRVPEAALAHVRALKGNGAAAASVVVYGNRAYEDAMLELADVLTEAGFVVIGGGAFIARHSLVTAIASGRPNRDDLNEARDFGRALREKVEAAKELTPLTLPGNRPYRKFGGLAFKPVTGDTCNRCGTCAVNCPTGAIPLDDPSKTDPEKCISCMRCASLCPQHARALAPEARDAMAAKLCRVCADELRNEVYL